MTNTRKTSQSADVIPEIGPHQFVGWFFEPHPSLGWKMRANQQAIFHKPDIHTHVSTNRQGFRWPDFPVNKAIDKQRILILADSFGVAIEVEQGQTFASRLQAAFDLHSSTEKEPFVEILNASVGGYGTEQEFLYLQENITALEPDLILVCFHFGDDLIENNPELRARIHWRLVKLPRPYLVSQKFGEFIRVSDPGTEQQANQAWMRYYDFLPHHLIKKVVPQNQLSQHSLSKRLFRKFAERLNNRSHNRKDNTIPLDLLIYASQQDTVFEEAWQHTSALLAGCLHLANLHGARLAVVGICTKEQIVPNYLVKRVQNAPDSSAYSFDPYYPNRRLAEILNILDIPLIDLTPVFEKAQHAGECLFFDHDLHWNPQGHALAAKALFKALRQLSLDKT